MSNYPHRGTSNGRARGRASFSRGGGRGRGGGRSIAPRLPSLLSDELGFQRRPKPLFRDDDRPSRGRGAFAPGRGGPTPRGEPAPRGGGGRPRGESQKKRKRSSPTPETEEEAELEVAAPKRVKPIIEKGSGFRTKVSANAQTPLARMLAAQGGGSPSPSPSDDEQAEEPIKKRKKPTTSTNDIVDISIMGGAFGGTGKGKKTQAELDEDAEIAWLEYQLRRGKGNGVDDEFGDDGLDDLLSFADKIVPDGEGDGEEMEDEEMDEDDMEELPSDVDEDFTGFEDEQDDQLDDFNTTDEDSEDDMAELTRANTARNAIPQEPKPETPRDPIPTSTPSAATPVAASKYVPPHLRNLIPTMDAPKVEKSVEQIKLERKLQGLLNKLSEANIESILNEIEALYRDHSRNSVTSTITDLVINLISDRANLLDSFVILYATLLAALYKVKGLEFGAHVIQTLVLKYNTLVNQLQGTAAEEEQAGKQPLNMLTLIAELYNFQVISCRLIYDLIRGFIDTLVPQGGVTGVEFPVEGLLKVLRASGSQLRTDDPSSLKDIVQLVQQKTAGQEAKMTTRAKFMVETLVNVKNNKMRAIPGGEIAAEATQKMKRFLGGLTKKKHILAHEPIRVTLDDLLNAETKGKWWLVGAAWAGNPLVDRQKEMEASKATDDANAKKKAKIAAAIENDDEELDLLGTDNHEELIKLAKKQGMNTDIRRSIFIIMMTSDDYVHACDRLSALKFNETQQRDFVRVALHCCGVETRYNPYYTLILQNLCESSFSHRFTFQYAMWDFLREMGETDVGGAAVVGSGGHSGTMGFGTENKISKTRIANLAKMCGWLIAKGAVDLTIFKPVDFTSLQPKTKTFFRSMLTYIFLGVRTESPLFKLPPAKTSQSGKPVTTQAVEDARDLIRATFQKSLAHTSLAQGMNYFLRSNDMKKIVNGDALEEIGEQGRAVVKDGLKVARDVVVVAA
ncbi:suppressor of glycerol defect [Naganishia albida]|nr:suppressor of glycerol defect [Naganishia albida]